MAGSDRCLFSEVIVPIKDNNSAAFVAVVVGSEWRSWCSDEMRLLLVGRDLVKLGWETVERIWEM